MFYVSCWWENERLLWCTHWLVNLKVHRECHKSLWCPREGDFTSEAEINKIIKKERCLAWWLLVVYVSVFWLRAAPSFQSRHNSHSWNQLRSHCLSINICKTSQQRVKINHTTPGSKICSRLQRLWEFDIIIHDLFFFHKEQNLLMAYSEKGWQRRRTASIYLLLCVRSAWFLQFWDFLSYLKAGVVRRRLSG